jgi:Ta0938
MKRNYTGCAICDSTWGNVWEEVEGERMFFCCGLCATQFRRLVDRVKVVSGWGEIESIEIAGDRRGRTVVAHRGAATLRFRVTFTSLGEVHKFETLPVA